MNTDYLSCRAGNRKIFVCVIPQLNPHYFVGGKACNLFFPPPSLQKSFPVFPTNPKTDGQADRMQNIKVAWLSVYFSTPWGCC